MSEKQQTILTPEQQRIVNEFRSYYDIQPEEIIFFDSEPVPFIGYEATCRLCNLLAEIRRIDIGIAGEQFPDASAFRCEIELPGGTVRAAVGVVNRGETINGKSLSTQQIAFVGQARAIRNALRASGIDLYRLHREWMDRGEVPQANPKSLRNNLLAEIHALGEEAGLIEGESKRGWYRLLHYRYDAKTSAELTDDQLADFAAVLKTLVPQGRRAAA